MERSNRLTNASITDGSLDVVDDDDVTRVQIGKLDDDLFGLIVRDGNGNVRFQGDDRGLVAPTIIGSTQSVNDGVVATGSLVVTHKVYVSEVAHQGFEIRIPFDATGAVTIEAQVFDATGGFLSTGLFSAAGVFQGQARFQWLHGIPLGTSPEELWIFARKAAGAGTLTIRPAIVWGRSPVGCTATGL